MWRTFKRAGLLLSLVFCTGVSAQELRYRDIAELNAANRRVWGVQPAADGKHYTVLEQGGIVRYGYASAKDREVLLPLSLPMADYQFSSDGKRILLAHGALPIYRRSYMTEYYLAQPGSAVLHPILREQAGTRDASFSPDGRTVAFSSGNNLYLYDVESEEVIQVTNDGAWNKVINGTTDWVYEEECGFTRAYAFSPDSRQIAYLRFDESQVPLFEMMRYDGALYNKAFSFKYPKAGDPNSVADLFVYDLASGETRRIDVGPDRGQYLLQPLWTPGGELVFQRMNRRQNHFEAVLCRANGTQKVIYNERSPHYVDHGNKVLHFLADGKRFIVSEESSAGWMHLYLYSIERGLLGPITRGKWEVTNFVGVRGDQVYYTSTEGSSLRRNLYRIGLDGRGKQRLTTERRFYTIAPSANLDYYIAESSTNNTPYRTEIFNANGKSVRVLQENAALAARLPEAGLSEREFFDLITERGDTLPAYIVRPRDFDPARKYPVLLTQYSGPGSQQVVDRWSPDWEDALVSHGYIVVCADPRGTGFRGEKFKKLTYGRMGEMEVEDQLSLARYMAALPYVDAARIGIYGWSYGGFMALGSAFRGNGLFKMAIAVAPVTSWRYYDSIYTENFNGLPEDHPAGYDDNSPINLAHLFDDARTRLLIIHGTADDNVHFQNTVEMTRALNRLGKQYDMMVYPDQNHSMRPDDMIHVREKMLQYTLENL